MGSPGQTGTNDDTGVAARFYSPVGVAADKAGNVYVADYLNSTIRMVTSAGVVSTLAGRAGFPGTNDGTGTGARFSNPTGLALDAAGNIYVADSPHIRKVTAAGVVTTLPTAFMALGIPTGLAVDSATNIYVTDQGDDTILKVSTNGAVTVLAGSTGHFGTNDGTNGTARFFDPEGITVDATGNLYVSDSGNGTIRLVTSNGVVTTLAGSPGQLGSADGTNGTARFYYPMGLALDQAGNLYVADRNGQEIRRMSSAGVVTTIGGTASVSGNMDGTNTAAQFHNPTGVAVNGGGRLFVADAFNERISQGTLLPPLSIQPAGANIMVSWPSPSTGFDLQQNSSLANSGGWSPPLNSTNDDGTNKSVLISSPAANQYFRLIGN